MEIGDIYKVKYPFVRVKVSLPDDEGLYEIMSWNPGVEWRYLNDIHYAQDDGGDCVADGEGFVMFTIISLHKPGKYPERVFYTRKWEDPDGNVFGKNLLKITTKQNFKALVKGYRYEYTIEDKSNV